MHDRQLYKTRQTLLRSEAEISKEIDTALAKARRRAVAFAQSQEHKTSGIGRGWSGLKLWPSQAWGMGATFASAAAVVIGLNLAEQANIDQTLNRIAVIDQKMISGPLPVQAYLDPGFLVFQEASLEQTGNKTLTNGTESTFMQRAAEMRSFWSAESLFPGFTGNTQQGPSWAKLTASQREALAPLESLWGEMAPHRKQKWIRIADRFHMLSSEQQARALERMQEWGSLPASERRQARAIYDGVKEIIPEDVRVMKWNEYQKLSAKERERLVELAQQRTGMATTTATDASPAPATPAPPPHSALSKHSDKPLFAQ